MVLSALLSLAGLSQDLLEGILKFILEMIESVQKQKQEKDDRLFLLMKMLSGLAWVDRWQVMDTNLR